MSYTIIGFGNVGQALIQARGAPAAHFNRAVCERLKPGSYVIVEHAAALGAGASELNLATRRCSMPISPMAEA